MKQQMINPNKLSQVEMMNNQAMAGMASLLLKLGKGKRKFDIKMESYNKKFLGRLIEGMKKQMAGYGDNPQTKGVIDFFDYLILESKNKEKIVKLSYEELDFLKKTLGASAKQLEEQKFKWYQFLKKLIFKVTLKQYKELMNEINK